MRPPRPPFALETPAFSFPALAALAAKAPIGSARDVAIAAFQVARLAEEVRPGGLSAEERRDRAAGTRKWMASMTVAEPIRKALLDLVSATEQDASSTAPALRRVMEVTGGQLDGPSRSELERLAREIESQTVVRT